MAAPVSEGLDRREAARWRWSDTALDRLVEFGFNEAEVYRALLTPTVRRPGNARGTQVWTRGRIAAVVNPSAYVVVTIMDAYGARPTLRSVAMPQRVEPPPPIAAPEPERYPEPEQVADPREVKNMAERIRLLSAEHAKEVPRIPLHWLRQVCLPRLRDYPGRWARLLSAPYASVVDALVEQIRPVLTSEGDDIELTVRGPHIYGRSL